MDISNLKKHVIMLSSCDIREISKPLTKFGISHFKYERAYQDSTRITLCNDPNWIEHYFANDLYNYGTFNGNYKLYKSGYILLDTLSDRRIFQHAQEYFNIDHGIVIIKDAKNYCEFFHFASTPDNYAITNFYLNNIGLLDRFTLYFKDKAKKILLKADQNRLRIPIRPEIHIIDKPESLTNNLSKQFVKETEIKHYYLHVFDNEVAITKREMDCLMLHAIGKSVPEIAKHLFRSPKTVRNHLDSIKNKFNYKNKSELIKLFFNHDFAFSLIKTLVDNLND